VIWRAHPLARAKLAKRPFSRPRDPSFPRTLRGLADGPGLAASMRMRLASRVTLALVIVLAVLGAPATPVSGAETGVTSCRRLPAGKRVVKLNLKPETEVRDLVAWISSITCESFVVSGTIAAGKHVTIYSPQLITTAEAYGLFLAALDSVGLTVYREGKLLRIIETSKARMSAIPVFGFDEELPGS